MTETAYLVIDPGEKRTGWAKFDENGETIGFGAILGIDNFMDWLEDQEKPGELIFENYRVNPGISHAWSKVKTIELIGLIRRYCTKNSIKYTEQRNTDLSIGLRYLGMYEVYFRGRKRIKHVDDEISALAHGVYYLVKNNIRPHRLAKP